MITLNKHFVWYTFLAITLGSMATRADAVDVTMVLDIPHIGVASAAFTGFDSNRNGHIRSSEGEIESATFRWAMFPAPDDDYWSSTVDIDWSYWATSISPNIIETQLNRFSIYSVIRDMRFSDHVSFSYGWDKDWNGFTPQYHVNYSSGSSFSGTLFDPPTGTNLTVNSSSTGNDAYLQSMSSTGPLVPEPSTLALMLAGLGAFGILARRRT